MRYLPIRRAAGLSDPPASRWQSCYAHWLWLAAIVAAAAVLRLVQVDREALWADEALTLVIRHWPVTDLLLRPADPTGALYYLLAKWFVPEDGGLLAVRALSVGFGTASVVAMYAVARISFSPRWGLVAASMLAVSTVLVDYSQEARAYSLLVLLVLCSAAGLLWWVHTLRTRQPSRGALAVFAIAAVSSFYAHFAAVFWILPSVIGGREITDRLGNRSSRRAYLVAAGAMALAAVPEVYRIFARAAYGGLGFLANVGPAEFLATTVEVLLPSTLWDGRDGSSGATSLAILAAILAYSLWRIRAGRTLLRSWASANPAAPLVVLSLLALPLIVWLFGFAHSPIFMVRTILLAVPGFILFLVLVGSVERPPVVPFLFLAASALALILHGTVRQKEPWLPVARYLQAAASPGDGIVICPHWRAPSLLHALGGGGVHPLFLVSNANIILMRGDLNGPGWERNYRLPVNPVAEASMGIATTIPFTRPVTVPPRLWLVESQCTGRSQELLRDFVDGSPARQLLQLGGGPKHAGIRLSVIDGKARARMVNVPVAGARPPAK
jgi:mannosyltransferase